jgi:hypothetical protein
VVRPQQIQSRLALFLVHAGSDDDGRCTGAVRIGANPHPGLCEVRGMVEIGYFAFCTMDVNVNQDYVGCQIRHKKGEGRGGSDRASAHDGDLDAVDGLWLKLVL